jgi:TonB family protein
MRRSWRLALALALTAASGAAAADRLAAAETEEVRFVDAVPPRPSAAERLGEIRRRIQAALEYPPLARRQGLEGVAWVRFEIGHDGAARKVRLFRTSGRPSLDRAATRAVLAAAPLPWVYGRLEVPVRFALEERRGTTTR